VHAQDPKWESAASNGAAANGFVHKVVVVDRSTHAEIKDLFLNRGTDGQFVANLIRNFFLAHTGVACQRFQLRERESGLRAGRASWHIDHRHWHRRSMSVSAQIHRAFAPEENGLNLLLPCLMLVAQPPDRLRELAMNEETKT
jgi:hypothetical protein